MVELLKAGFAGGGFGREMGIWIGMVIKQEERGACGDEVLISLRSAVSD